MSFPLDTRVVISLTAGKPGLPFHVLEFDAEDAWQSGEIRASLAAKGRPIGPIDALIAGQARARGLILVTHNTAEFARVDGLRIEDWEA